MISPLLDEIGNAYVHRPHALAGKTVVVHVNQGLKHTHRLNMNVNEIIANSMT